MSAYNRLPLLQTITIVQQSLRHIVILKGIFNTFV